MEILRKTFKKVWKQEGNLEFITNYMNVSAYLLSARVVEWQTPET